MLKKSKHKTIAATILLISSFTANAAPSITLEKVSTLTNNASTWWDSRYGDSYLNSLSYSQDSIVSYNGWQYAAFYDANRYVAVSRRQLPDGAWETVSLTDYTQTVNDSHNNISLGFSPKDGRLHLSFDHHDNDLHYRYSDANVITNPASVTWSASLFGNVQDHLNNGKITPMTYPRFITAPDGTLTFEGRVGHSGNGESWIWQYNNNGSWSEIGKFVENTYSGGDNNAYFFGIRYDKNNRLHAAWAWRETPNGSTNHDISYAYSDDHGATWKNNAGVQVAVTGSSFITADSDVKIWTIDAGTGLINQEGMIVDKQGRVHVIARRNIDGTNRQFHYWRSNNGTWTEVNTGIYTKKWSNRSKIAYDKDGNIYAIMPNLQIASASIANNYNDWVVIDTSKNGQYHHSEPLIDPYTLESGTDILYVYAQQGTVKSTSRNIDVIKYKLNGSTFSGWSACANEGQTCKFNGTQKVRYGAQNSFYSGSYTDSVLCSNSTFGDPLHGVEKLCETNVAANTLTNQWTTCANEWGNCSFNGTREVRYGAEGLFFSQILTDTASCTNASFGDANHLQVKYCQVSTSETANTLLDTWRIKNRNSGKCLRTANSATTNSTRIVQATCDGSASEKWTVEQVSNGLYRLKHNASGKAADINRGSKTSGTNNIIWSIHAGKNQQWRLINQGDGYYHIMNVNSGLLLDIKDDSTMDNAENIQSTADNSTAQDWALIK